MNEYLRHAKSLSHPTFFVVYESSVSQLRVVLTSESVTKGKTNMKNRRTQTFINTANINAPKLESLRIDIQTWLVL